MVTVINVFVLRAKHFDHVHQGFDVLAVPLGNVEEALEVITTDGKGKLLQGIRVGDCANRC